MTKRGLGRSLTLPPFSYTGSLRPDRVGPPRAVPDSVPKPDYYFSTFPEEEVESRQQRTPKQRRPEELAGIRKACELGRHVLDLVSRAAKPGVTTDELDRIAHEAIVGAGAYPAPLRYFGFPKSLCTSVNEVICHGIPDRRPLEDGDLVNLDVTVLLDGWFGDLNETVVVGTADEETKRLVKTTYECLEQAIALVKPGARYRDLGETIATHARKNGLSVVTAYCGHGIGDLFHCAPNVPHYSGNKARGIMKEGEVFTIEPMINLGRAKDVTWPDGWTAATVDGKRSAQFEHQIVVTKDGCEVLTKRTPTSPPLCFEV